MLSRIYRLAGTLFLAVMVAINSYNGILRIPGAVLMLILVVYSFVSFIKGHQ